MYGYQYNLAHQIKRRREGLQWDRRRLALACVPNLHESTISRIEHPKPEYGEPRMSTIMRIAHALGTTGVTLCADPPEPTDAGVPVEGFKGAAGALEERTSDMFGTGAATPLPGRPEGTQGDMIRALPLGGPDRMDGGDGMERWNAETAPIPCPRRRRVRRAPGPSRVRRWLRALGRFLSLARA